MSVSLSRIFLLLLVSFILAGCSARESVSTSVQSRDEDLGAIEKKVGETEMSGKILQSGGKIFLFKKDGSQVEVDSYAIDLESYSGQEVSVVGQFSGDTLFVGKIQ